MTEEVWNRIGVIRHNKGEHDFFNNINASYRYAKFLDDIRNRRTSLNRAIVLPDETTESDRNLIQNHAELLRETKIKSNLVDFEIIEVKAGDLPPKYTRASDNFNSMEPSKKNMVHFVWYLTGDGEKILKRLKRATHFLYTIDPETLELSTQVAIDNINTMLESEIVQYDIIEFLLKRNFDGVEELRRRVVYDKLSRTVDPRGHIWKRS